ncbi:unnamed protein product [Blepharisma stoltei]|uniref:F-box domain-containing protein n=1 Tax=Blepharisma stoltei TaxID=1481888 RepID=A0AAU9K5U4_9CILI|nr:unnamed protein product [Blepharisma stoltei]
MQKIPNPILSEILRIVGPFNQIVSLSRVCKRWKEIIRNSHHYVSFIGNQKDSLLPSNIKISMLMRWNILHLDLRGLSYSTQKLIHILTRNPFLVSLSISDFGENLRAVWQSLLRSNNGKFKENKIFRSLEVLRIYKSYLGDHFGADISQLCPCLKKLYVRNTKIPIEDLIEILVKLRKLEILDISINSSLEKPPQNLTELLADSSLKVVFVSPALCDAELLYSRNPNIRVVGQTLENILENSDLSLLENWLLAGGDPNFLENPKPQLDFIKKYSNDPKNDDEFLYEAFKIMLRFGLDISTHINHSEFLFSKALRLGFFKLADFLLRNGCDIWPKKLTRDERSPILLAAELWNKDPSFLHTFVNLKLHTGDYFLKRFCNPYCIVMENERFDQDLYNFLIKNKFPYFRCPSHQNILICNASVLKYGIESQFELFPLDIVYEAAVYNICEAAVYNICENHKNISIEIVKYLVTKDIKPLEETYKNILKKTGNYDHMILEPLLLLAVQRKQDKIVEILAEAGFDLNVKNQYGWTPLIAAASRGYTDIIKYLCEKGALIDEKDSTGKTALHFAVINGQKEAAFELIGQNADISAPCIQKLTPLDYARWKKKNQIAMILESVGAKGTFVNFDSA